MPAPIPLPPPRIDGHALRIREAVPGRAADLAFIDALQRPATRAVGWMPRAQLEGHIQKRNVLIAERDHGGRREPIGYCIGVDRYFKRDDVGVIYQLNINAAHRRGLVGAALLKAQFDRSAYGCRLYGCWCAQDLPANRFWEAMGFAPIAFRTGSRGRGPSHDEHGNFRGRIHIYWQKRIRPGDHGDVTQGGTPWWFPSLTGGGALREDRIVLPIPPGTHWTDAKPIVLPPELRQLPAPAAEDQADHDEKLKALNHQARQTAKVAKKAAQQAEAAAARRAGSLAAGGLRFGEPPEVRAARQAEQDKQRAIEERRVVKAAARRQAKKNDPKLEAFARELRDRWQEQIAHRPQLVGHNPKYAITREAVRVSSAKPQIVVEQPSSPRLIGSIPVERRAA